MLLLVDAGNTRIKWAVARPEAPPGDWLASAALAHDDLPSLPTTWASWPLTSVLVANVAGAKVAAHIEAAIEAVIGEKIGEVIGEVTGAARPALGAPTWFRSQPVCAGVINGYRDPGQLGCDRFASLIGARYRYPGRALLVVTAGTATTVDALDASGRFIGGMILPGLRTMAQSLALNTALLPAVDDALSGRLFADNTQEAIVSGCLQAQVGAILQAHAQLPSALCVLSGGAAPYVAPQLPFACERIDNLVLLGLHVAALTEAK